MRRFERVIWTLLVFGAGVCLGILCEQTFFSSKDAKVESGAIGQVLKPDKVDLEKRGFKEFNDKVFDNMAGDVRFYPQRTSEKENFEEYQRLLSDWEAKRGKKEYWTSFYAPDYSVIIKRYKP